MNCYTGNLSIDQFTQKDSYTQLSWHHSSPLADIYITDTGVLLTVWHSILVFYHSDTLATSSNIIGVKKVSISFLILWSVQLVAKNYHNAALLLRCLKQLFWISKIPKTLKLCDILQLELRVINSNNE